MLLSLNGSRLTSPLTISYSGTVAGPPSPVRRGIDVDVEPDEAAGAPARQLLQHGPFDVASDLENGAREIRDEAMKPFEGAMLITGKPDSAI